VERTSNLAENRPIVLYDGLCGLCDGVVQFLLRHDRKDVFRFAAQQSDFAQQILMRHGQGTNGADSIRVIENYGSPTEKILIKSEATLRIAERLGGIWKLALIAHIMPHWLRDACYDWIARNRYKIFGKRNACRIPTANDRHKFLG
jgi:predicted DCC family thiol-disulfide oxidoreductase YuxK